jgi:hypothetical protein
MSTTAVASSCSPDAKGHLEAVRSSTRIIRDRPKLQRIHRPGRVRDPRAQDAHSGAPKSGPDAVRVCQRRGRSGVDRRRARRQGHRPAGFGRYAARHQSDARTLRATGPAREAWPGPEFAQQPVGQLPCRHNVVLLSKLKDGSASLAYAARTVEHGWSRAVLVHHIEARTVERQGRSSGTTTGGSGEISSTAGQGWGARIIDQVSADPVNFLGRTSANAPEEHYAREDAQEAKSALRHQVSTKSALSRHQAEALEIASVPRSLQELSSRQQCRTTTAGREPFENKA